MLRIKPISDCHLEFRSFKNSRKFLKRLPNEDVDVLVIAGDFGTLYRWVATERDFETGELGRLNYQQPCLMSALAVACDRFKHVIYVCGNHDYWHVSPHRVHTQLQKFDDTHSNFHWLRNKTVEIEDIIFAGTTMWYDLNDPSRAVFGRSSLPRAHPMNDFSMIKAGREWGGTETADWIQEEHELAVAFLNEAVPGADYVVTHHAPLWESSRRSRFYGDRLQIFYVNDMSALINRARPPVWHHGHMHEHMDYEVGLGIPTRVIANPRGYPTESKNPEEWATTVHTSEFDQNMVVELNPWRKYVQDGC